MKNKLMMGLWRYILNVPSFLWEKQIAMATRKFEKDHQFMTGEHRNVHHFVVKDLPRTGQTMAPGYIAESLGMTPERVNTILDDLETHMTFLYRNDRGEVVWAYPVTVEKTPHHVTFHTGETLYAA